MAHIEVIPHHEAEGALAREYDKRFRSAGRIWNIVSIQSQNPETLRESMRLYGAAMFCESGVSRSQREMIAIVVSDANGCHY
jgi:alkylhydroperoxidase family enzyme